MKLKLILKLLFLLWAVGLFIFLLSATPPKEVSDTEILYILPSYAVSAPGSVLIIGLFKILKIFNFDGQLIEGYQFRIHFYLLNAFFGYLQFFYFLPSVFQNFQKWIKKVN